MRKNFGATSWFLPMPLVFVSTYNEDGSPNVMTCAWTGIYDEEHVFLSLEMDCKTMHNIALNRSFTISFATQEYAEACRYVGEVSGFDDPNKFKEAGFTATPSTIVFAPLIEELPFSLECVLVSCENGIVIAKILNTSIQEWALGEDGRPDIRKMDLLTYDPIHDALWPLESKRGF